MSPTVGGRRAGKESTSEFMQLFAGRRDVYGLGRGGVRHAELTAEHYRAHLFGEPEADIGVFPMLDSAEVWFGAIDLDEHNPELALRLAAKLPGPVWIEESRSKGYHVWAFFDEPVAAWAVRAVLRAATVAAGAPTTEIFPKQDGLRPGMIGNYINLPLYGNTRPILMRSDDEPDLTPPGYAVKSFLTEGLSSRQSGELWVRRARAVGAVPPESRTPSDFGEQGHLHICAQYIIDHKDDNPVVEGHRATVLFNLSKMLLNSGLYDFDEVGLLVEAVNQASTAPIPASEVNRFIRNAERGQFTSTGCDDPLMANYISPKCPIANG